MDYEAIAKKVDEALIDQVNDDGGVLHRHKIAKVVESVLRKMVPAPMPSYAYGGLCLKAPIIADGVTAWGDSGVDPTEWR